MTEMTMWMGTVAVAVVAALVLVWLGYWLAIQGLRDAHTYIEQQKAALDAEWWQLNQTRRIRSVFSAARQAMRYEAARPVWPPVTDNENQEGTR